MGYALKTALSARDIIMPAQEELKAGGNEKCIIVWQK